uniref:Uncharacterized protein n=1 Tax=Chromera velia CCMP2878 TaxID=1169474 RepID=A0A0G4FVF6_9ALVE|eukprot:Cvel_504.t1-p1 / transcript=Cvel_504.t1 / gene=Cvel_504 / organism=Chromera_velia_CCMP2878 / gene_product=Putative ankyrin repeat protein RF_0381, putative / transcript_product=Putative ankyrin repeat protein RF_0381, putative / location=Cvel_scaffold15:225495-226859(+) / protein_length=455 / sequence_SO=supercontig / SO=protein_coding / is_pseudo=false
MERNAATLAPVRQGLQAIVESLQEVVAMVQNMDALLGDVKFCDLPVRDAPSSSLVVQERSISAPLPREAAALDRLTELVEDMRKGVRVELNVLMSLYYRMDLEPLFAVDIGNVIRSFQVFTAEMLREALNEFMETGERGKRDDLALILKVGAALDAVVEVPPANPEGIGDGGEGEACQETALMRAVDFGSLEAVQMLVGAGAGLEVRREGSEWEGGKRALHIACREGKPEIAEFLVCSGAEVDAVTDQGVTPLYYAAQEGLTDLVRFLLGRGADVHAKTDDGRTSIFNAIAGGHQAVVELLLDHGAKVDEKNGFGETPLFCTAHYFEEIPRDHRDIAGLLISRGADVNARSDMGLTTLHAASWNGAVGVVGVLLENGADIRNAGYTALHYAAFLVEEDSEEKEREMFEKKLRLAQLLVSKGIDVDALNENGETALDVAEARQLEDSPLLAFLRGL